MARALKLFVVDTGPLITLAAAQSLDFLLYVEADLVIPDAVLHEATRDAGRLGAQDIIDWVKAHRAHVEIAPTKAYQIYDAARATIPNLREPDLAERAGRAASRVVRLDGRDEATRTAIHRLVRRRDQNRER